VTIKMGLDRHNLKPEVVLQVNTNNVIEITSAKDKQRAWNSEKPRPVALN
jgi:hypothetical protein